ncbi:unnamed protein product, partial [Ectocarpus sp. 12 AP-2014]
RGGSAGLFGWAVLQMKGGAAQSSQISANALPDVGGAAWAFVVVVGALTRVASSSRGFCGWVGGAGVHLAMERRPP